MKIKLLEETDPFLKQVADPWDFEVDGDPSELILEMGKIMLINIGIGLAAMQVGVKKRIFIMGNDIQIIPYINPEIIAGYGDEVGSEGCLSFPQLYLKVRRFTEIRVRYQNKNGEFNEEVLTGLAARVFQHEYDHLNGICFVTKVGSVSLMRARQKRQKLRKSFDQSDGSTFGSSFSEF